MRCGDGVGGWVVRLGVFGLWGIWGWEESLVWEVLGVVGVGMCEGVLVMVVFVWGF